MYYTKLKKNTQGFYLQSLKEILNYKKKGGNQENNIGKPPSNVLP